MPLLPAHLPGYWPLLAIVLIAVVVTALVRRNAAFPYRAVESLLTQAELRFYLALQAAVGGRLAIMTKVRVADVITVKGDTRSRSRLMAFNRIAAKHIDFVLADPKTLRIVAAVELDDRSHEREDRIARDRFLNRAFEVAGVPLLRLRVARQYAPAELRRLLADAVPG